jgi:hypothetical protein
MERMSEKFGRDIIPIIFMGIFVGGLVWLALTVH